MHVELRPHAYHVARSGSFVHFILFGRNTVAENGVINEFNGMPAIFVE